MTTRPEWTTGGWIEYAGLRITTPRDAMLRWPLLAPDPYKKDGAATPCRAVAASLDILRRKFGFAQH